MARFVCMHYTILRLREDWTIRVGCHAWGKLSYQFPASNDFYISFDVRIFGYFSNRIHLFRRTLKICCLTLGAKMNFMAEAMLCKVYRPGDGKPYFVRKFSYTNDCRVFVNKLLGRPSFLQVTTLHRHNSTHTTLHGPFLHSHNSIRHNSTPPQFNTQQLDKLQFDTKHFDTLQLGTSQLDTA